MGIDLCAFTEEFVLGSIAAGDDEPFQSWKARKESGGQVGYVRESYHGVTHAVFEFCPETYGDSELPPGVKVLGDSYYYIPSSILKSRMPAVEEACRQRAQDYYDRGGDTIEERDAYATSQISDFRKIVKAVKKAESRGSKVYLYNSY